MCSTEKENSPKLTIYEYYFPKSMGTETCCRECIVLLLVRITAPRFAKIKTFPISFSLRFHRSEMFGRKRQTGAERNWSTTVAGTLSGRDNYVSSPNVNLVVFAFQDAYFFMKSRIRVFPAENRTKIRKIILVGISASTMYHSA